MKIAIGADHRGFELKSRLIAFLKKEGHQIKDCGTKSTDACDYPAIGYSVAKSVSSGESERGILICMSGIGMSIIANKVPGVRAAICRTKTDAQLSREHNDANVMVISAKYATDNPEDMLKCWFSADIRDVRHKKRVKQIMDIEKKILKGEM
ncbi:MAG: ribose 5-phosphate isomerase B [Candidatus Omnitrophica bacterium]|nr:ribose 5-phosphate isomerase B [Candidatus Omnitrophota bacterium]